MKILFLNAGYCMGFTKGTWQYITGFWRYLKIGNKFLKKIVSFIKEVNPDIVALAEVDSGSPRASFINQIDFIKRECGFFSSIFRCKYKTSGLLRKLLPKNNNAVLVKDNLDSSHQFHDLDNGIKCLVIEINFESSINFFLVHLALTKSSRKKQMEQLSHHIRSLKQPVIVVGDFNLFEDFSGELDYLMKECKLRSANENRQPTFPAWRPKYELDFFLVSPRIKIKNFQIFSEVISDHLPILLECEV